MFLKDKKSFEIGTAISFFILILFVVYVFSLFEKKKETSPEVKTSEQIFEKKEDLTGLEIIGRARLSYAGGTEGRNRNIELGIERIDGVTIAPGEEFSFAKALGSIAIEDGFSEEKVFLNGEVIKGLGGGLCQVSTTLFRSVIDAGLPVTDRTNHSYTVPFYDVGLDATYAEKGPDLKFVNDTSSPITIKGRTENKTAIFEIYGIHDGRLASTTEAEISEIVNIPPTKYAYVNVLEEGQTECINNPQIGYTSKVIYGVEYPTGEYKEQIFTSKYKPLQRVCYVVGVEGLKAFSSNLDSTFKNQ